MAMSVKPGKNAPVGLIRYFKISIVPAKNASHYRTEQHVDDLIGNTGKPIRRVLPSSMLNEPRTMATAPSMVTYRNRFTCLTV